MKCANCTKDAFYIYQVTSSSQVLYCNTHLPKFLEQAKKAGLLKTTEALKSVIAEGLKNITTPAVEIAPVEEVVEELIVEEPVVEEAVTPKPKKKATKKKAE